jgi:hypothetical protein
MQKSLTLPVCSADETVTDFCGAPATAVEKHQKVEQREK